MSGAVPLLPHYAFVARIRQLSLIHWKTVISHVFSKDCKNYTWSPFVPHLPWLAHCGGWNFLRDMGGFIVSTYSLHYLCIYLYFRCKVCSYPIVHMKIILTTENCHHFPPEITPLFLLTTLYTTSLIPLVYSTTSVSHPSPLSAANRFSHLNFSVGNPSYVSPMVSWMYVGGLNL